MIVVGHMVSLLKKEQNYEMKELEKTKGIFLKRGKINVKIDTSKMYKKYKKMK